MTELARSASDDCMSSKIVEERSNKGLCKA